MILMITILIIVSIIKLNPALIAMHNLLSFHSGL